MSLLAIVRQILDRKRDAVLLGQLHVLRLPLHRDPAPDIEVRLQSDQYFKH